MKLPQIYVVASNRGLEIGYVVNISETDYFDYFFKLKAREILPLLYKKLPSSGLELSKLDSL